jgi:flagellar basal body-associated protein FliL
MQQPPAKPRQSRVMLILVAVMAALALGAYYFFGDSAAEYEQLCDSLANLNAGHPGQVGYEQRYAAEMEKCMVKARSDMTRAGQR